ncbi:ATP-grasp domain-containing protein OS=Streptomyces fumanus OX=67302 GN=GCM10018772_05940 PE=4 SV=1 [Streptomyces fumanus]|uniref:ATP-grasp domain-containing protein n=2 Tax=Streptomyces fumanus TaxID=67302 RepID=A0A919DWK5_9ACTN|nr:ATP-grasp domain-containing protein [Streptomyces fumanus]GHE85489.1 ATP-grasp domain-containing protein [Streptomyces fumanus]
MSPFDTRVPAVVLRVDRNPFHHGTLGAVRSLGRAGVEVHVVADCADSPVGASRYLHRLHTPPPPGASPAQVAEALRRVAAGLHGPAVLVPMDDLGAIAVARTRAELTPRYLLPELPGPLPERLADKAELAAVCAALDVPHPVTVLPDSAAEAVRAVGRLGPPVVAKWSRPWLLPAGSGLRSTRLVHSARQVRELYARTGEAGGRLLLQAFLPPGPDRDWFFHGYADHRGVLRAGGTGVKTRARPRGAGLTAVGRWAADPGVRAPAERIVAELGYRGVLDLDFRRCGSTGRYHLLDFNPRPGAQFRLFTDTAGLDVVRALHLDLTGRALPVGAAVPGRVFVAENYAPLAALRPAPGGRERAWHARDDRAPGRALWRMWGRHAAGRLVRRPRRPDAAGGGPAVPGTATARLPHQADPADPVGLGDGERAGRR